MTFLPWLPPALAATSTARLEQANKSVTACGDWGEADVSKTPASIEELQAHHCSTTTNTLPSMTFLYLICSHPTSTPATSPSATSLLLAVVHPSIGCWCQGCLLFLCVPPSLRRVKYLNIVRLGVAFRVRYLLVGGSYWYVNVVVHNKQQPPLLVVVALVVVVGSRCRRSSWCLHTMSCGCYHCFSAR
jgi:hypothetical protein